MLGIVFAGPAIKHFKVNLSRFQTFSCILFPTEIIEMDTLNFSCRYKECSLLFQCFLSTKFEHDEESDDND